MGRRRTRKGKKRGSRATSRKLAQCADPTAAIRAHLERGQTKQALEAARAWRKATPGSEADDLYLEAARARIAQLGERGLFDAAEQLALSVAERFPDARVGADLLSIQSELRRGCPDRVLSEFVREDLAADRRQMIGEMIAEEIADPSQVARSEALPADHPLKREAEAAVRALAAATSDTQDLAALARETEVPRSSPFAAWKLLALGIEAAYQGDAATVERIARQMSPRARPARLLPVLRALAGGRPLEDPTPATVRLLGEIRRGSGAAAADLVALETAIERQHDRLAARLAGDLLRWFRTKAPALHADFRRLLHQACLSPGVPLDALVQVIRSVGPRTMERHLALDLERLGNHEHAIALWERYLSHAASRRAPAEVALVRRKQAELAALCEDDPWDAEPCCCPDCQERREAGEDPQDWMERPPAIEPASSYLRMAVEAYPVPESWRMLAKAIEVEGDPKEHRKTLEAWHEARPGDLEPLLMLLEAAERRGAIRKALRLLEEAEAVDPANPEVREGRYRLLVEGARRRLRLGKAHLSKKDVAALEGLPRAVEPSARLLTRALAWLTARTGGSKAELDQAFEALVEVAGEAGAVLATAEVIAFVEPQRLPDGPPPPRAPDTVPPPAGARALALLEQAFGRVGWPVRAGAELALSLFTAMSDGFEPPSEELLPLCRWATRHRKLGLLFLASGVGLRRGGPQGYRFLLERARSLSGLDADPDRIVACLQATQTLARRANDRARAAEASQELLAVDLHLHYVTDPETWEQSCAEERPEMDPSDASRILAEEAAAKLDAVAARPKRRRGSGPRAETVRDASRAASRHASRAASQRAPRAASRHASRAASQRAPRAASRRASRAASRGASRRKPPELGPTLFDLELPDAGPADGTPGPEVTDAETDA